MGKQLPLGGEKLQGYTPKAAGRLQEAYRLWEESLPEAPGSSWGKPSGAGLQQPGLWSGTAEEGSSLAAAPGASASRSLQETPRSRAGDLAPAQPL